MQRQDDRCGSEGTGARTGPARKRREPRGLRRGASRPCTPTLDVCDVGGVPSLRRCAVRGCLPMTDLHVACPCDSGVADEGELMTLTQLREQAAALGHVELSVVNTSSGRRWFVECSCGYRSATRATRALAVDAARHHIEVEVKKVQTSGVSLRSREVTRP